MSTNIDHIFLFFSFSGGMLQLRKTDRLLQLDSAPRFVLYSGQPRSTPSLSFKRDVFPINWSE